MLMVNPQWQGWAASDAVSAGAASLARFVGREPDHEVAVPPFHSLHETDGVLGLDEQVRQARDVLETLQRHRPERLVYLAGDCGAELSPIAWVNGSRADLSVVWIDAHADLNTPRSSQSATFHGMVLRSLLGEGPHEFLDLIERPLTPGQVTLVGARALDPAEKMYIQEQGIACLSPSDVHLTGPVYVHIDLDCLDPRHFGHTPFREPDGLHPDDVTVLLRRLRRDSDVDVVGIGVTESMATQAELVAVADLLGEISALLD
ncbi:MAG: arginase family protein [Candidatus Nanopelagicales bacterium]